MFTVVAQTADTLPPPKLKRLKAEIFSFNSRLRASTYPLKQPTTEGSTAIDFWANKTFSRRHVLNVYGSGTNSEYITVVETETSESKDIFLQFTL